MKIFTNADPIANIIVKYKEHASIIVIKNTFSCQLFSFKTVDMYKMLKEIKNLNPSKVTKESDNSTEIVKENADLFADFLRSAFNECVLNF